LFPFLSWPVIWFRVICYLLTNICRICFIHLLCMCDCMGMALYRWLGRLRDPVSSY
jgi:hypothetical protein